MFERYPEWGVVQNYLCDFFNTTKTSSINLQGLEYVLSFTACEPNILMMRSYEVNMKKSGRAPLMSSWRRWYLPGFGPQKNTTSRPRSKETSPETAQSGQDRQDKEHHTRLGWF
eukprot:sb/3476914/